MLRQRETYSNLYRAWRAARSMYAHAPQKQNNASRLAHAQQPAMRARAALKAAAAKISSSRGNMCLLYGENRSENKAAVMSCVWILMIAAKIEMARKSGGGIEMAKISKAAGEEMKRRRKQQRSAKKKKK